MSERSAQIDETVPRSLGEIAQQPCEYCGLPTSVPASSSSCYCCYGCRFAHAVVQEQGREGAIRWTVIRLGLAIFFTMNLMAFTMTMWSLDVYDVQPDPFQKTLFEVFRWLSMVFAFPVLLLLGLPLLQNAVESWRQRVYSTDLLIGLAVLAAYTTSVINVVRSSGAVYFEVGATVLVMMTLGRWIEAVGKQKATESLDRLLTLLPETVTRFDTAGDPAVESPIPISHIQVRDVLRIRAGERFPADSVITRGVTSVDEQVFTGESQPVRKEPGDRVLAGTINLDGDLLVEVTAGYKEGSFGRLLKILQEARNARGYYQRLADRVAGWFFPVVTAVAAAAFAWHFSQGVGAAIQTSMSVLLIACPCALGLATPLAVWTALSTAIRHQVLFRSGEAVERLAGVRAICLDKTGTLTTGTPRVFQTAAFGLEDTTEAFLMAEQLAGASAHPFSKAVTDYLNDRRRSSAIQPAESIGRQNGTSLETVQRHALNDREGQPTQAVSVVDPVITPTPARCPDLLHIHTVPGGGVEATAADGTLMRLGSVEFACCRMHDGEPMVPEPVTPDLCVACRAVVPLNIRVQLDRLRMAADQQAASIVLLSINRVPAVGFLISEAIRPESRAALEQLLQSSQSLHVLSGDRPSKGRFLTEQLQVPGLHVECSLNPEQKVARVTAVRHQFGTTAMVGDGINDAPALAASDVGIAMGCGADVSRDSAQVCLLSNDLTRIPWAIHLARRTRAVIRQNLFWAFGYNAIGVCLAAGGFLNPAIAAGLMIVSSLLVISNSLRLLRDHSIPAEAAA
ncbi:MAG: cation-translocating P-type ATPase [Planctomycetaceae bacterium]